jgi:SnoaL-like domain
MNDLTSTIDIYLAAWTEQDTDRRAKLIDEVWADDGRLIDPPLAAEGRAAISDMAAALQTQFPGHAFRRASGIDAHHDHFRFAWELVGPDGTVAVAGLDVGEVAADGRLARITGFFGELPQ